MKTCKLEGCQSEVGPKSGFGYCRPHYRRFKKYGDPVAKIADKKCLECSTDFAPEHTACKVCPGCRKPREKRKAVEHRAANREKLIEYNRQWRRDNPTYHSEYNKRWRKENEAEYRAYYRKYRDENLDKVRAAYAAWEAQNPQHTTEWGRRNREQARETVRRRRARLRSVQTFEVTAGDITRMVARNNGNCTYCHGPLEAEYHMDHIMPVSLGGSNGIGNLTPACATCNVSKGNRLLSEWRYRDRLSKPLRRRASTHIPV